MEGRKEPRKVTLRTYLITAAILILAGAIAYAILAWRADSELREARIQQGRSLALALAVSERSAVLDRRYQDVRRDFAEIVDLPRVEYLVLMDTNGRAVVHTDQKYLGQKLTDPISRDAQNSDKQILEQRLPRDSTYDIAVPVMSATRRMAVLRVGISAK